MGKLVRIVPIAAALLIVGAGGYVVWDMATERGRIEDWIGHQILGIANSYLEPQLEFASFDYQAPGTVDLAGVSFVAPDGTILFEATRLSVTLAERPRYGRPIRIASLLLESPTLNIIRDADGGLVGFSQIVKPREGETFEEREQKVEEQFRLSTVLELQQVRLRGGRVRYVEGPEKEPMVLDDFTSDLDITPAGDGSAGDGPGWYAISFDAGRRPAMTVRMDGRVNLDSFELVIDEGGFELAIDERSLGSLPSRLQTLLREHDTRGALEASMTGRAPLKDPMATDLSVTAELREFSFAAGEYRVPIDEATLEFAMKGRDLVASIEKATALDGSIWVDARATLGGNSSAKVSADGLDLEALLRSRQGGPDLAGRLTFSAQANAVVSDPLGTISGGGEASVTEGRLMVLPGLRQLASAMEVATVGASRTHQASATFEFLPEGVRITESKVITNFLAARGQGMIGYDAVMDMTVNAGPMERVQEALGRVGGLLGRITDQLMTYDMTGPLNEPKVSPRVGK